MDTNIQSKMDGMNNKMDGMKKEMKDNMASMATEDGMKNEMKVLRDEMQRIWLNLQAGQDQLRRETKKESEAVKKSAKRDTKR